MYLANGEEQKQKKKSLRVLASWAASVYMVRICSYAAVLPTCRRRLEEARGEARENMALHRGGGRNCCAEASGPLDGAAREEYNPRLHGACGLPGGGVRALLEATLIPIPRFRLSPAASSSSFLVSLTSTSLFYQRHDRSIVIVAVDPRRRRGG